MKIASAENVAGIFAGIAARQACAPLAIEAGHGLSGDRIQRPPVNWYAAPPQRREAQDV